MNVFIKISALCFILATKQCAKFDEPELDHNAQLAIGEETEKGIPASQFNKGLIEDFSGEIYSWWGLSGKVDLSKKADTLKIIHTKIGPLYTPFGRQLTPLDFTETPVIKVRCRAEGKTAPMLSVHLKDQNGYDANASAPIVKVALGGYQDYYFSFKDKWKQLYPDAQKVDETMISDIMFFINPGLAEWTGTLYVDEIKAVRYEDIPKKDAVAGGIIDNFEDEPTSWWSGSSKISLEKEAEKDIVKILVSGAGPAYETFGKGFDEIDFTKSPIIRIKAKGDENTDGTLPQLRVGVKDKDGYVANEFPLIAAITSKDNFKNYYFNFKDKYSQNYPDAHAVDAKAISGIVMFINPGGAAYNGTIYIDDIEVISEKKYQELIATEKN